MRMLTYFTIKKMTSIMTMHAYPIKNSTSQEHHHNSCIFHSKTITKHDENACFLNN